MISYQHSSTFLFMQKSDKDEPMLTHVFQLRWNRHHVFFHVAEQLVIFRSLDRKTLGPRNLNHSHIIYVWYINRRFGWNDFFNDRSCFLCIHFSNSTYPTAPYMKHVSPAVTHTYGHFLPVSYLAKHGYRTFHAFRGGLLSDFNCSIFPWQESFVGHP